MTARQKRNVLGLRIYLEELGIDVKRVLESGLDETGYDYIETDHEGRPLYDSSAPGNGTHYARERRAWPSQEVWTNVEILLNGGGIGDFESEKETKPKPKKEAPVE